MKATTSIFIDKTHPKKDGKCAVSLRVTYDRKKRYYATPYSLTAADFEKVQGEKPREPFKAIKLKLAEFEKKASDIIDTLPVFTWAMFERMYLQNRGAKNTVSLAFAEHIEALRENHSIGTAVVYECSKKSIEAYAPDVKFAEISPDFLKRYEKHMIEQGASVTTISIYLRALRTLFNNAIADGVLSKELYPFGKKRYEIPTGKNVKKSLTLNEIAAIYNYEVPGNGYKAMAKDFWVLMYLCNGINVKDLCLLKNSNIQGDVLVFERAKTAKTKRTVEPIRVVLTEDVKAIIKKWGVKSLDPSQFVFPILKKTMTPERQRQVIQQLTKVINKYMRKIGEDLKINKVLTTYTARHSFATILQRSGVSTEFISEALGHSNIKTTQNYLAGFEDDAKKETVKVLTAFKTASIQ